MARGEPGSFYDHYKQLLTAWRLWNAVRSNKIPPPNETRRYELLKQASEAEAALECLLIRLASERFLSRLVQKRLALFRQGCQIVRQSVRENGTVPWHSSQVPSYLAFKEGASLFASLIRKRAWTLPTTQWLARRAVAEITHNKYESSDERHWGEQPTRPKQEETRVPLGNTVSR
jgi:hypothetical protein